MKNKIQKIRGWACRRRKKLLYYPLQAPHAFSLAVPILDSCNIYRAKKDVCDNCTRKKCNPIRVTLTVKEG